MGCYNSSESRKKIEPNYDEERKKKEKKDECISISKELNIDSKKSSILIAENSEIGLQSILKVNQGNSESNILLKSSFSQGIPNLGNTCFMNATIQCLAHTPDFFNNIIQNNDVSSSLYQVLTSLNQNSSVKKSMKGFLKTISKKNAAWGLKKPQDCKEFLVFLLNNIILIEKSMFSWTVQKEISPSCGHNEFLTENFYFLVLMSLSAESILKSIELKITGNIYDNYFCSICNKELQCNETRHFLQKPSIIIFYIDPSKSRKISFKEILEIQYGEKKLHLYAAILAVDRGIRHFISVCKNSINWRIYDDSQIRELTSKNVEGIYMLFFKLS